MTTRRSPTNSSSTGSRTASTRRPPEATDSLYVHRNLQAGLLKTGLQRRELVGELAEVAVAEFCKDEVVELFLLGSQGGDVLIGLVGQRHLDDPGVLIRRFP